MNAAKGDFTLRADSPALARGFVPIPLDKIGLYDAPERASWPVRHAVTVRKFAHHLSRAQVEPRRVAQVPRGQHAVSGALLHLNESPLQKAIEGPAVAAHVDHDGEVVGCDYLYLPKAGFSSHSRIVQT